MAKDRTSFVGVQIGDRRFSEHSISLKNKEDKEYIPLYALPGCGFNSKYDERTATLDQLQKVFKGKTVFYE